MFSSSEHLLSPRGGELTPEHGASSQLVGAVAKAKTQPWNPWKGRAWQRHEKSRWRHRRRDLGMAKHESSLRFLRWTAWNSTVDDEPLHFLMNTHYLGKIALARVCHLKAAIPCSTETLGSGGTSMFMLTCKRQRWKAWNAFFEKEMQRNHPMAISGSRCSKTRHGTILKSFLHVFYIKTSRSAAVSNSFSQKDVFFAGRGWYARWVLTWNKLQYVECGLSFCVLPACSDANSTSCLRRCWHRCSHHWPDGDVRHERGAARISFVLTCSSFLIGFLQLDRKSVV